MIMRDWTPEEIEQFRKEHRLTRKKLGELTGCTVSTIYKYERGLRTPGKTTKILLSRVEDDLLKAEQKTKRKESGKYGKRDL